MKTKDFIKMLQEADPSGEGYLRMSGGVPIMAEPKEGYWDGSYYFIDENGNFVTSTQHYKIDIHQLDLEGFVSDFVESNGEANCQWEKLRNKLIFDIGNHAEIRQQEKKESVYKRAKAEFDDCVALYQKLDKQNLENILEHEKEGWVWFQNKEVDNKELKFNNHYYYTWKIYDKTGKEQWSCVANTAQVMKSGLFERLDNNKKVGYYEWILKK